MIISKQQVKKLKKQVIKEPNNTYLRNKLAIALIESNQYEKAYVQFRKAAMIKKRGIQELNNLAYFYYTEGKPLINHKEYKWDTADDKAIELLQKVISQNPTSHFPYNLLGEIYTVKEEGEKAIKLLLQSTQLEPSYEAFNNLGVCYYKNSMLDKAAKYFLKSHLLRPKECTSLYPLFSYGICLAKLGEIKDALDVADQLSALNQELEELGDDETAFIYYLTESYSEFATAYSKLDLNFYSVDWLPPYFYSLYKIGEEDRVKQIVANLIKYKTKEMEEAYLEDDEEWTPEDREEYIKDTKSDIEFLKKQEKKISEGYKPSIDFEPNVEKGCYLFGCYRHGHPNYGKNY